MFAKLSEDPSFSDNFKTFIALAPVTTFTLPLLISAITEAGTLNLLKVASILTPEFNNLGMLSTAKVSPIFGKIASLPGIAK